MVPSDLLDVELPQTIHLFKKKKLSVKHIKVKHNEMSYSCIIVPNL